MSKRYDRDHPLARLGGLDPAEPLPEDVQRQLDAAMKVASEHYEADVAALRQRVAALRGYGADS